MKGLNAVVTGSTGGIGKAVAHKLASRGCNIVINGIEKESDVIGDVNALAAEYGVTVRYSGADMRDPDQIAAMIKETHDALGTVDILVNNAGIQHKDRIENFPAAKWDAIIAINLSSAFYTMKAAVPLMRQKDFGRIVNIASAHGLRASPEKAAYVAAKHGIMGLGKVVALENADKNITVNTVCPGWVETPLVQKQIEDLAEKNGTDYKAEAEKLVGEKQPNKRFQTPECIGDAVLYFADPGNRFTTGAHLSVDGGWTAK